MRLALAALALLLASCGHATTVRAGRGQPVGVGFDAAVTTTAVPVAQRVTTTQRAGRDYRRIARPKDALKDALAVRKDATATALASWYGEGARTANGERFDPNGLTFAHRSMPFGTRVTFCHGGRCVTARCNDRGPFIGGRTFDLSRAAFAALAPLGAGVVSVDWSYA